MGVLKYRPIFLIVVDNLMYLVGLHGSLEIYKAACVFPAFKDMADCVSRPLSRIIRVIAVCVAGTHIVKRSRRWYLLLGQHTGNLCWAIPGKAKAVYLPYYRGGFFINDETLVLAHKIAVYRAACDGLPHSCP